MKNMLDYLNKMAATNKGQNTPGTYETNLNAMSRQSPTGKFVSDSMTPQGFNGIRKLSRPSFGQNGAFGNEVFSGSGMDRNMNTGISNLNRTRVRK